MDCSDLIDQKIGHGDGFSASQRSEYDKAVKVLVHEPSDELFLGVLHPDAALFSDYFDYNVVAKEHAAYCSELNKAGVDVVHLRDILLQGTVDSQGEVTEGVELQALRDFAAESLIYNIDGISNDGSATVSQQDYHRRIIDMATPVDLVRIILHRPEIQLHRTDMNTGYSATYSQRPVMNLMYMRDQMIVTSKGVVIGRMNSDQRQVESRIVDFCLRKLNVLPIGYIQGEGSYLEGGDFLPFGDKAFIGCGLRTSQQAIDQLMNNDLLGCEELIVVHDKLMSQRQVHLDICFNVIDKDLVTMTYDRYKADKGSPLYLSFDLYTRKEGKYTNKICGGNFVDYLVNTLRLTVIPISDTDQRSYANNYLTVSARKIMAVAGQSEELKEAFESHGVEVIWVSIPNVVKGYGALHCLTQVLETV